MNGFNEKENALYIDNVPLSRIADECGTPCYVYSASHIRGQYESLQNAMESALPADRQPLFCYACKANSNIAVLKLLQSLGSAIEVVSYGELQRALKAGFTPEKIVVEGVGKTRREITAGLEADVHQFNVESLGELDLINEIAGEMGKTAKIVFRLNPDVGGAAFDKITTGRKDDKFGLPPARVMEGYARAKDMDHVEALGLFTHIGSQISAPDSFEQLFKKIAAFTGELRAAGYTVSRLDIGGGFPIQYRDEKLLDLKAYAQSVADIILPLETEIILEPGRFLVGNAGVLLSEVLYVKENDERRFLIVDAAMNDLMRPALYDAWHTIEPAENRNARITTYDVAGPVCETSDFFARERDMPEMNPGDLVAIRSAGAYGFCMASNYNTRALPAEVLVDGENYALIRERQEIESILELDKVPDWL